MVLPLALLIRVDALLSVWMGNWRSKWDSSPSHAAELGRLDDIEPLILDYFDYFDYNGSLSDSKIHLSI